MKNASKTAKQLLGEAIPEEVTPEVSAPGQEEKKTITLNLTPAEIEWLCPLVYDAAETDGGAEAQSVSDQLQAAVNPDQDPADAEDSGEGEDAGWE